MFPRIPPSSLSNTSRFSSDDNQTPDPSKENKPSSAEQGSKNFGNIVSSRPPSPNKLQINYRLKPQFIHAEVKELTKQEMTAAVGALSKNIPEWASQHPPIRRRNAKFAERLKNTNDLLDVMSKERFDSGKHTLLCHGAAAKPGGVLILENTSPPEIAFAVTSPDSKKYGRALIECAVQISVHRDEKGVLTLIPRDDNSAAALERWGAVYDNDELSMTIDPRTSDKWKKDADDNYRLKE